MYSYGVWKSVLNKTNYKGVTVFNAYNNIKKAFDKGELDKSRPIAFLRFSEGDQRLQDQLHEEGYKLFPSYKFSKFIRSRNYYLPYIPRSYGNTLERQYFYNFEDMKRSIRWDLFKSDRVVIKVSTLHATEGKWLVNKGEFPNGIKVKYQKKPFIVEEFVENARSIRVGYIGNPNDKRNYFISEMINDSWLKNFNPEKELVWTLGERYGTEIPFIDDMIKVVKLIGKKFGANLIGVDFVVTETNFYILELNDMIGLPDSDYVEEMFYKHIQNLIE